MKYINCLTVLTGYSSQDTQDTGYSGDISGTGKENQGTFDPSLSISTSFQVTGRIVLTLEAALNIPVTTILLHHSPHLELSMSLSLSWSVIGQILG